ncbi:MAG: MFS transporter [bacterium]
MIKTRLPPLKALYFNFFTRQFALSLFSLFGPLFVAQLFGFGKYGITLAVLYYLGFRLVMVCFALPAGKIIERFGFRRSMLLSLFLLVFHYICLFLSQTQAFFLVPALVFGGLLVPLYWLPYHLIVSEDSDDAWFGKEVSNLAFLTRFSDVLAPAIGGLLIAKLGYSWLFGVSIILILISFAPLGLMFRHGTHQSFSLQEIARGILSPTRRAEWVSLFSAGFHDSLEGILWVFVMFSILQGVAILGFVRSLSMVVMLVAIFLAGKYLDKTRQAGKLLIRASRLDAFLWLSRFLVHTPLVLIGSEFLVRVSRGLLWTPFDAITYHKARQSKNGAFFFLLRREVVLNLGRALGLLLVLAIVLSGLDLRWGVLFGALASLMLAPPKGWWTRAESNR